MKYLNMIPFGGWFIALLICFFSAVPIMFLWNWLVPIYLPMIPDLYKDLPFVHVVGLIWLISSLSGMVFRGGFSVSENSSK